LRSIGSFILSRVTGQFIVSFEILEWELSTDWNSNPMFCANPLLQKTFSLVWELYLKKYLTVNWGGQLGL